MVTIYTRISNLYNRLHTNIVNTDRLISEFGLVGKDIGKVIEKARKTLISNPQLTNEEIERIVISQLP